MNRRIFFLCAAMMIAAIPVKADPFEKTLRRNLWNMGANVNGIRQDSLDVSQAFLAGRIEEGGLRDVHDAPLGWNVGAHAKTLTHLKTFSMKGAFGFDHSAFYDRCGSMFITPGLYPVDVLEFTPGFKTLQTYSFDGGLSSDLGRHWRIGADLDFGAQNIAKRKDLRHSNYRLEMSFAPGIMFHSGSFALGANYLLERSTETVKAEQVGQKDNYSAFLDKGMMFGAQGIWTDAALHLAEAGADGFPVVENRNGAAVQLSWGPVFAQVKYLHGRGKAGEKQNIWFRFPTDELSLDLALRLAELHTLKISAVGTRMQNHESVLEKFTEGGVTVNREIGSNLIYVREGLTLRPSYEFESALLYAYLKGEYGRTAETLTHMYPYVERRNVDSWAVEGGLFRTLDGSPYGEFELGIAAALCGASVSDAESLAGTASGVQGVPVRCDWNSAHVAYLSTPRLRVEPSVRFNFNGGIFAGADIFVLRGLGNGVYGGLMRVGAEMKFGYNF